MKVSAMIINDNGYLIRAEDSDIDEMGRITLPLHVKKIDEEAFIGVSNNASLKQIIVNEGVIKIEGGTFCYLPNVEKVILPKSLKFLGSKGNAKVFDNHIEMEMKCNPKFYRNCFANQNEYILNKLEELQERLEKAKTIEEVEECLKIYDSLIEHAYMNSELKVHFDKVTGKVISVLEKEIDGKEIGAILIGKYFREDKMLSEALLQYDGYKDHKNLGIEECFKPILFGTCRKTSAVIAETGEIIVDIEALWRKVKKDAQRKEVTTREVNMLMLHTMRHETAHLYFSERAKKSETMEDKLIAIDKKLIESQDGYSTGNDSWHIAKHDCMPEEINADLIAFNLLENDLVEDYNLSENIREYIAMHKERRIAKVVDVYGMEKGTDVRKVIMEEALASDRLSQDEREKVEKIYNEYNLLKNKVRK